MHYLPIVLARYSRALLLAAWALFIGTALFAVVALGAPPAGALPLEGDLPPVGPDTPIGTYLTINNLGVLFLTGALLPIVNGLLLRPENPAWVKVLVANVVAVAVHAFSQQVQADGTAILSQEWFVGLGLTIVPMIAAYLGVWAPLVNVNRRLPTLPVGDVLAGQRGLHHRA